MRWFGLAMVLIPGIVLLSVKMIEAGGWKLFLFSVAWTAVTMLLLLGVA